MSRQSEKSLSQTLRAALGVRDLLYSGSFRPGERLSEIALSDRLGLSRTPIRAALARLEQEGLVEVIPSGGYAVRTFSEADIIDAIELRGVLEGTAARLAAERGVSDQLMDALAGTLAELDEIVSPPVEDLDFERYHEWNAIFHDQLKNLSGSKIIRQEIERVTNMPFADPSAFLKAQVDFPEFRASLQVGQEHHRAILDAVANREGARAEALAREHARLAKRNLDQVMKSQTLKDAVPGLFLVAV